MSDSIFIKNSIFNDTDSLSSSKTLRVDGVIPHQLTFNSSPISTLISKKPSKEITAEVVSQKIIDYTKRNIAIKPLSIYVPSQKVSTYVYEKKKTYLDFDIINTEVIFNSMNADIRSSSDMFYIKEANQKTNFLTMPFITMKVDNKKPKECIVETINLKVTEGIKKSEDGLLTFPIVSIDVNNDYPMSEGPLGTASGGDLEKMVFTIQQMSFFEFRFYFRTNKVQEVRNLPEGLLFDAIKQRMYGTPLQSGRYPITITLEDGSVVQGIIDVPKLNRKL